MHTRWKMIVFTIATLSMRCMVLTSFDPEDLSTQCHFDGEEDTECGQCIASSCQDALSDSCLDEYGGYELDEVSACATSPGTNCDYLYGDIDECVGLHCALVCQLENWCADMFTGDGSCEQCTLSQCSSYLGYDCCDNSECLGVHETIHECDATLSCDTCAELYQPDYSTYSDAEYLKYCITSNCYENCFSPCF